MNKKEGIGKYKVGQQVAICGFIEEINIENLRDIENTTHLVINTLTRTIDANPKYETVITDLNKPKPVVPQYVADWYEGNNGDLNGALFTMVRLWDEKSRNSDFYRWFRKNKKAFQTLVNMHQFGYDVEKETRYTVRIRNLNVKNRFLVYGNFEGTWEFSPRYISNENYRVYHTRKDLEEAGFGWVFDCEGIVIEEVEE